jgi:hypothetical protein
MWGEDGHVTRQAQIKTLQATEELLQTPEGRRGKEVFSPTSF